MQAGRQTLSSIVHSFKPRLAVAWRSACCDPWSAAWLGGSAARAPGRRAATRRAPRGARPGGRAADRPGRRERAPAARAQVIPFLVLAVGVDNMFILAHALERRPPARGAGVAPGAPDAAGACVDLPERLGAALAAAGPSVTLAAAAEALAFAAGALSGMPAVRNFSIAAALAVVLDYGLQARPPWPRRACLAPNAKPLTCISRSSMKGVGASRAAAAGAAPRTLQAVGPGADGRPRAAR